MALKFIKNLPDVNFAVQYGSSILKKANKTIDPRAQVDLIIAVDDPLTWHA